MRLEWNLTLKYNDVTVLITDYDIGNNTQYGLTINSITQTFNGVPTVELSFLSQEVDPTQKLIERYLLKRASVLIERVVYNDQNQQQSRAGILSGFVDSISTSDNEALLVLSCLGWQQLLQNPIGRKYSPKCGAVFGQMDGYLPCGYDTSVLHHMELTVVSTDQYEGERIITLTDTGTQPYGPVRVLFNLPYLSKTQYLQASLSSGNVIAMDEPLAYPPPVGTKVTLTKSCTKELTGSTANNCSYFNNTSNFKGQPYLIEQQTAITPYVYTILPSNKRLNLD